MTPPPEPPVRLPARLSVVTLGVRDMAAQRAFYRALDWPEALGSDDTWSGFLLGGVLLALYPETELAAEAVGPTDAGPTGVATVTGGTGAATGWSGVTLACNVDRRDDVDGAFAAAVAAGARPVAEPVDRPWGGRSAYVADPEGNRWEIAWAASARFDGRGALIGFG